MRTGKVIGLVFALVLLLSAAVVRGSATAPPSKPIVYTDPVTWKLEIDGMVLGDLRIPAGLENKSEVVEYQSGDGQTARKLPGRPTYGSITFERELDPADRFFVKWRQTVLDGKVERKSGSIILLDREGNEVARYNFYEGWPAKWLVRPENGHVIEQIEICYERFEMK